MNDHALIDVADSVLIVIDVQDTFLDKLAAKQRAPLVDRIGWLVDVASHMDVPVVVTAEDVQNQGGVCTALAGHLPVGTAIHDKMSFGLAADSAILQAVNATGRKTAILTGLETDVCVTHSAIGLMEQGYRVAVVRDATCSPDTAHEYGLRRVASAGATVVSVKGLFYEWVRTVPCALELEKQLLGKLTLPDGIIL